jgi:hypothetical protein
MYLVWLPDNESWYNFVHPLISVNVTWNHTSLTTVYVDKKKNCATCHLVLLLLQSYLRQKNTAVNTHNAKSAGHGILPNIASNAVPIITTVIIGPPRPLVYFIILHITTDVVSSSAFASNAKERIQAISRKNFSIVPTIIFALC